jgi:hypothetical protein
MRIYKYELDLISPPQPHAIHEDSTILSIQNQRGKLVMWAEVDVTKPKELRVFRVYGTGWTMVTGEKRKYLGTVQFQDGYEVYHVYELTP